MDIKIILITAAVAVAVISLFVVFKTKILRETGDATSPYSLSKFQLWLWTTVICPLFAIHWAYHPVFTDTNPSIDKTSLILLGISGGVALASNLVAQATVQNNTTPTVLPKALSATKGFWIDMLTGNDGKMPVERLQHLLFTFVYIVIYVAFFFNNNMQYYGFDNYAYILMGISSGSYLIGKGMNR